MDIRYSSKPTGDKIYSTVELIEDGPQGSTVKVGCFINNHDSRKACAQELRQEALNALERALDALRNSDPR